MRGTDRQVPTSELELELAQKLTECKPHPAFRGPVLPPHSHTTHQPPSTHDVGSAICAHLNSGPAKMNRGVTGHAGCIHHRPGWLRRLAVLMLCATAPWHRCHVHGAARAGAKSSDRIVMTNAAMAALEPSRQALHPDDGGQRTRYVDGGSGSNGSEAGAAATGQPAGGGGVGPGASGSPMPYSWLTDTGTRAAAVLQQGDQRRLCVCRGRVGWIGG